MTMYSTWLTIIPSFALFVYDIFANTRNCVSEFNYAMMCENHDYGPDIIAPAPSLLSCSFQCTTNDRCLFFSYETMNCRIYFEGNTSASNATISCSTKILVVSLLKHPCRKRIGTPCTNSSDCLLENSMCWQNTCRCRPGFSYRNSDESCVASCDVYGSTFTVFEHLRLVGCCDDVNYIYDIEQCKDVCVNNQSTVCRSFSYVIDRGRCKPITTTIESLYLVEYNERFHFFQRDCA